MQDGCREEGHFRAASSAAGNHATLPPLKGSLQWLRCRIWISPVLLFAAAGSLNPWLVKGQSVDPRPLLVGWHASLAINQRGRDMGAGEAFASWKLPWHRDCASGWRIDSHFNLRGGWLGGRGATAGLLRAGPALSIRPSESPFWIEFGIHPTFLTRHTFGELDLGIAFQFTSYAGMNWDLTPHWGLGYRFEHMSNASLSSSNPGLNSHTFTVYYRF
ncbi:MAG: acyloxyacyl hydrolase [Verrucomicrobiota bacterium]|nr:acyloxyacyl hydrolase [Limisphaera sp.]MDW8380701.1 acyloxyacyl hydrolase [Verrucomicrobiota bacterium]